MFWKWEQLGSLVILFEDQEFDHTEELTRFGWNGFKLY